ncbi:MAG: hypothetical protein BMS9Abin29_0741 [Gemmatimonadota bacterium]|nr:MAG: hypothetical protein BMS9Abin29_0741 [Gemmatimonadota bacterium]
MAVTIVPELSTVDEDVWRRTEAIIAEGLAGRPNAISRQLVLFIRAVNVLALVRFRRPFHALDGARRLRLLSLLENAPILAIRRGVWGLRTLVFMGYYGQDDVKARLGYRAHPLGWRAVRREGADS